MDPLKAPWRSRRGAGCIFIENEAHYQAFWGTAKTGPPTTKTLPFETSSRFTSDRRATLSLIGVAPQQQQQRSHSRLPPFLFKAVLLLAADSP
eukprot:6215666-Pyramimonas_sp.AAC.1